MLRYSKENNLVTEFFFILVIIKLIGMIHKGIYTGFSLTTFAIAIELGWR